MAKSERVVQYTAAEIDEMRRRGESRTDWAYVDALTEEELEASIDHEEEGEFDLGTLQPGIPGPTQPVTLVLDAEVLEWFQAQGIAGYKWSMSNVLRDFVAAQMEQEALASAPRQTPLSQKPPHDPNSPSPPWRNRGPRPPVITCRRKRPRREWMDAAARPLEPLFPIRVSVFTKRNQVVPQTPTSVRGECLAMDNKTFDALTRRFGTQRNRRDALKAFAGGIVGIGLGREASAQVSAERANCGQSCSSNSDCNAGLECRNSDGSRVCVRRPDDGRSCNRNSECPADLDLCQNSRCVNQSTCNRCEAAADCRSGQACRNGTCGDCNRDRDCRSNEVCRNGRCERGGGGDCRRNSDCPRNRRCRNGRCVRRN